MEFDNRTTHAVDSFITCDIEIMSGTPVFKNTRVSNKKPHRLFRGWGKVLMNFWRTFRLSAVSKRSKALELAKEMILTHAYAHSH